MASIKDSQPQAEVETPAMDALSPSAFQVRDLKFSYTGHSVFDGISFDIARGKITALMGANGSGKSTLFKLLTKNLRAAPGSNITLDDRNLADYRLSELARKVAVVWQHNSAPYDITVRQLVAFGRVPHKHHFQALSQADEAAIDEAIEICDLRAVAERRGMKIGEIVGRRDIKVGGSIGETYEAVYDLIRSGGRMPLDGRWITGEDDTARHEHRQPRDVLRDLTTRTRR